MQIGYFIGLLIFALPACIILHKKNRGFGYYLLAFFFPFLGLIFALCLKKLDPKSEKSETPDFDITNDKTSSNQ